MYALSIDTAANTQRAMTATRVLASVAAEGAFSCNDWHLEQSKSHPRSNPV